MTYLSMLDSAALQYLDHTFVLVARPKLAIQRLLAGGIEDALSSVPGVLGWLVRELFISAIIQFVQKRRMARRDHSLRYTWVSHHESYSDYPTSSPFFQAPLPSFDISLRTTPTIGRKGESVLMRHEDLEPRDDLRERDRAITLPFLHSLHIVHHDHKVFFFALVMHFRLGGITAGHCYGM